MRGINEERNGTASERHVPKGTIKVHAPKSFGTLVLTDTVIAFSRAQPAIRISLILGDFTFRPYDFVENGFDMGIRISLIRDSSLIARKIGSVESILCASSEYLKQHARSLVAARHAIEELRSILADR